ncbi:MAG: energy transducer TonB [Kofleriaceae bacterium]|nr:energy transducer TonB [Kofleriaceae bacterium]
MIRTRKELDAFIEAEVASRSPFSKAIPRFLTALGEAQIDFSKEVLVLLRYTEPYISTKVRQGPTTLSLASQGKPLRNLRFRLQRNQPMAVADAVAEYCYPVIVDTTLVDTVSLEVDGQESYSVNLSKAPPIKVALRVREKWEPAPPRKMNPPVGKPVARLSYKQRRNPDPYKVDEYHRTNGERNYHPTPSVRTTFKSPRKRSDGKIRVCIDEEGIIIRVTALKSTGYPEYDAELLELIKKEWRYRPRSEDGLHTLLPSCPEYVFVVPTSPFVPRSP